jgi:hypothetical protein
MKSIKLLFISILLFILGGCDKEEGEQITQIPFSYSNIAGLMSKSTDYINSVSPGTCFDTVYYTATGGIQCFYTNYLYTDLPDIGNLYITYFFRENEKDNCRSICMYPSSDKLSTVEQLMSISETEYGKAETYYIEYIDDIGLVMKTFSSYDELWAFINDNGLSKTYIYYICAYYYQNPYHINVYGTWYYDGYSYAYFYSNVLISRDKPWQTGSIQSIKNSFNNSSIIPNDFDFKR